MKIGNLEVSPGEKKSGILPVTGCENEMPVTVICGEEEGPTVLITAGVHNAEYVGIQAAMELSREISPADVKGGLILVPLVNVSGFTRRTMSMVYEDGKNLNRVFPGNGEGTAAERISAVVEKELFSAADYYIDLHSGDGYEALIPYVYYVGPVEERVREISLKMARCVDVNYIVESKGTSGGAYNSASALGIPSILVERGGRGLWSREEVEQDKKDVRAVLAMLYEMKEEAAVQDKTPSAQKVFYDVVYENAPVHGCWYPCNKPGDIVKKDAVIGEIRDYFGNVIHTCRAKADGVILYQACSLTVLKDGPMITYGIL